MAKLTKKEEHIVEMYVRYFGRVATQDEIRSFDDVKTLSKITAEVRVNAANESGLKGSDYLNSIIQNLFGRSEANAFESKYAKKLDDNVYYNLPIATIIKNGSKDDKGVYNAKKLVAQMVADERGSYELDNITQENYKSIYNVKTGLTVKTIAELEARISNVPDIINGETIMLNAGVDTGKDFVGTAKNDLFLATAKNQWSVADSIDGGKGVDRLKIIDNDTTVDAFVQTDLEPVASTMKNIEILDIINNSTINVDTTSIKGITELYTTSKGGNTSTAAATTNINVTNTDIATTAEAIVVNGGKDVTVVSKNNVLDTITVGGTTAAAGTVTTVINDGYVDADAGAGANTTLGNTVITGGTKINASSKVEFTAAQITAAKTIILANQDTVAQGNVTVNGNASTTEVTVSQTAAQAAIGFVAATTDGQIAITAGNVTINDKNVASATLANTIETVSVTNAAVVNVNSAALATLNLAGTITTVNTTSAGSTGSATLALNTTGANITTINLDNDVKTLNVNSSTTASTIGTTNTIATTINVSGDAALTLNTLNLTAAAGNENIVVTNTAGVTITNALNDDVTFTGGTGADSISITATAKTIDLGAGDDTATISTTAFSAGGSLNGGAGKDTLVVTTVANSNIAGLPHIVGFETLRLDGVATGKHNAYTFKALQVAAITGATEFENVAAGVGLTLLAGTKTGGTTVTLANATGTADVFDLTLKSDGNLDAGTVVLAGVETIKINSVDTKIDTSIPTTVNDNDLILTATAAKSIVVTGNTNLDLVVTNAKLVTSFDASNATGNIEYTSANTTVGEIVTIKGGAGDDTLEGYATANDIITGGAGADTLVYTGRADTFTGGAGNDTFEVGANGTKALHLTIADLTKGDKIDLTTVANTTSVFSGGTASTAKITLGAAATLDNYLVTAAAGDGSAASITSWFQFEGNTYLVNDNTAGAFTDGSDTIVKITGLVDLSTSTYTAADIITIA